MSAKHGTRSSEPSPTTSESPQGLNAVGPIVTNEGGGSVASESENASVASPTKEDLEEKSPSPLALRSVVSTKEAGVVIGKAGKNVSEIRERSGAKVTVSEMVQGAYERVLTVTGPLDTVAKAYALVARKYLEETADGIQGNASLRTANVRLLVPNNRMGSVIGKGGCKIKEIQVASGSRLVASEDMLPGSTERVVTVSGVPDSIHIAVYHLGLILQQHTDRVAGTIPYKPTAKFNGNHGGNPHFGGHPSIGHYPNNYGNPYPPQGGPPPGPYHGGNNNGNNGGGPGGHRNSNATGSSSQQIFIPNDMVGCVIGKNGNNINEIRQLSGSHIKIGEPHGTSNERLVTVTGTAESNQMALYLLYSKLEQEKARHAQLQQNPQSGEEI